MKINLSDSERAARLVERLLKATQANAQLVRQIETMQQHINILAYDRMVLVIDPDGERATHVRAMVLEEQEQLKSKQAEKQIKEDDAA